MEKKITGNEPAFANPGNRFAADDIQNSSDGTTIRQYFAAMAIQGLLASKDVDAFGDMVSVAQQSIIAADALITELNKQTP